MKQIKRWISWLLVWCMLFSIIPVTVLADTTVVASGTCGEALDWLLDSDGILTISGNGSMTNYTSSNYNTAPWYEYKNNIFGVSIESGVTSIGDYAFNNYTSIKNISIPNTILYIGDQSFCYCSSLTSLVIPDSVTRIRWYAFYGCSGLKIVKLSSGMTLIDGSIFANCSNLESIHIPQSILTISKSAFENCTSLSTVCGTTGSYAETWAIENGYEFATDETNGTPTEGDDSTEEESTDSPTDIIWGSKENPYQVASPEDFNAVRNDLGAYYVQVCDIDLTGYENWVPIGNSTNAFTGEYDGASYSISGLNISVTDTSTNIEHIGLFGKSTGVIKNINLIDSTIETAIYCNYLGSVVGYANSVLNCSSNCNIEAICQSGGGIAGYADFVSECKYYGNAEFKDGAEYTYSYFGGICGKVEEIIACYDGGTLNSTVNWYFSYIGGIAGNLTGSANQCVNSGAVSCTNNIGSSGSGSSYTAFAGGISGFNGSNSIVQNSYNYGNIYGDGYVAMVGGISSCGGNASVYKYCYNKGELTYSSRYPYRGGIIGSARSSDPQYIYSCYWNNAYDCVGSGTWQPKVIYQDDNSGALEDAAFMNQDAFVGFDFEDIWEFGGGTSYPYPTLKAVNYTKVITPYDDAPGTDDESSLLEIAGLSIDKEHDNFYIFLGDSHIYNMDAPDSALYLDLDSISVIDDAVLTLADLIWTSSDENIFRVISSGDSSDSSINLRIEGITEGTATLTVTNPNGENISLDVTVVKPNALAFTNIYDTKQYYHAGAFYSAASAISDSVEIFVQFENKQIEGYPCKIEEELIENVSVIEPITLTASILGSGLSFDRNSYQSTYSATYDAVEYNTGIYDLLMLFPYDTESFVAGSSYVVEVTLESASFDAPLIETYSFTVYDAETQRVDEHINFINSNDYYKVSKQNIYGENMLELKDDPEYNWSVVTSLDFDNYYEIVLADLIVDMLDVYQVNTKVPIVLKNWYETHDSLLEDVTTMINDTYPGIFDVSELEIDKVLMGGKYTYDGIYVDDALYQKVLECFGNVGNAEKIQSFFAKVDETKSAFGIVKLTGDVVNDFIAWGNSIAVLNAFVETDENFKQAFRQVADNIPDSNKKMKEAVEDYLNYSEDFAGQFSEIYDSFCDLGVDVALDTFDGIVGKKLWDCAAAKAVGWIGKIPLSGGTATFASTTAYASLTTAIGSVATGVSLGLCLSDLICDSSDKAAEMSKIIAMSEYAPYIIQALEYYESNLFAVKNNNAVDLFENAFNLHKAAQSYIMEHIVSALQVKADSILQTILGNDDYDELVADILVQKNTIDNMECCGILTDDTIVYTTKVIAIKCPVDVYVYNESGEEIVGIINDTLDYVVDGLSIYIRDGAKYIALPTTQTYSIKIIATDVGIMEYLVMEFNENMQLERSLRKDAIPLVAGRVFTCEVVEALASALESYALTYDGVVVVPYDESAQNATIALVGDVDGTNDVNFFDGMYILQYYAGLIPETELNTSAADVDGNGAVDFFDGMYVLQYYAGIIDKLPVTG